MSTIAPTKSEDVLCVSPLILLTPDLKSNSVVDASARTVFGCVDRKLEKTMHEHIDAFNECVYAQQEKQKDVHYQTCVHDLIEISMKMTEVAKSLIAIAEAACCDCRERVLLIHLGVARELTPLMTYLTKVKKI